MHDAFAPGRRGLYCFADSIPTLEALLEGGARIVQLRQKTLDDNAFCELARQMLVKVRRYPEAVLIVNDRVEIARESGAHGIHVGQSDIACREAVQRMPPGAIVGVSVFTSGEALAAQQAGATYVGAGAVYPTPSKADARVIGIEALAAVAAAVRVPVVAIGGIAPSNLPAVMATGARFYAMISQINDYPDIPARLRELNALIAAGLPKEESP